MFNKYLIGLALLFSCFTIFPKASKSSFKNKDIISTLNTNLKQTSNTKLINDINKKDPNEFNDEELFKFVSKGLSTIKPLIKDENDPNFKKLENIKSFLIKTLKRYKVTGVSFSATVDPNLAFIYDNINPNIGITYKDEKNGNYLFKNYESSISSIGFKIEAAFCIDFIFIIGTELNFYKSRDKIDLGTGFSFNLPFFIFSGLNVTYTSIKDGPGGILIIGIPVGISSPALSYVSGGQLVSKK
ncbi:hypothetical protein K9L05_01170 [Candidatus Babeliales bacterium]|nr:hypothetical protein [Candidatus Babeliales bacterium]MCF7899241.1 hypothetical protein [Candidatus Babeliales bacterium]